MEEETQQSQPGALQFNEPLSWRAGKPIATGELLRRLEALAEELREMDQDEIDKDSFTKVAKELASQHLLGHKDKGVRALTGCCLVDVLKLCAPDAPFSGSQLKVGRLCDDREPLLTYVGHIHILYYFDTASTLRSLECIQHPAQVCACVSCGNQEYCTAGGRSLLRVAHPAPILFLL